ncbi:hypothetical protein ATANTOWER_012839 [Ataeniobius toweri]|uniref:Uncharacterized protein n=1 Tax=Ataeniobius toweri TaxID=208326 RepID=A0ABU7BYW3_9TELE|nr:hypothetical protein [Ataeniobius toweri]
MHLPQCFKKGKTIEDANISEGSSLFHLTQIQNALQYTNFTKFSKTSIYSYKNTRESWKGEFIHSFIHCFSAWPAVCRKAAFGLVTVVFVYFSHLLKTLLKMICSATVGAACTADAKGATASKYLPNPKLVEQKVMTGLFFVD